MGRVLTLITQNNDPIKYVMSVNAKNTCYTLKQMLFLETTAKMFTKKRMKSGHAQQFVYQYT